MDNGNGTPATRCRLTRPDGTRWRVTEFHWSDHGVRVDAVRANGSGPHGGKDPGEDSGARAADGDGSDRRLDSELLERGDRIQWLDEDDRVVWAMKVPVGMRRKGA